MTKWRGEENGLGNAGGIDSPTFVKDGGTSFPMRNLLTSSDPI